MRESGGKHHVCFRHRSPTPSRPLRLHGSPQQHYGAQLMTSATQAPLVPLIRRWEAFSGGGGMQSAVLCADPLSGTQWWRRWRRRRQCRRASHYHIMLSPPLEMGEGNRKSPRPRDEPGT